MNLFKSYGYRLKPGRRAGIFALVMAAFLCLPLGSLAQTTLKGGVEETAKPVNDNLQGQVLDAKTGTPVPEAQVTLPDQGFSMRTNKQGEYTIPRFFGRKPVIMSVEKLGYAPFALTITEDAPPKFFIRLQRQAASLVLDNQLRHLGDGSFSAASSSASYLHKPPDGPAIRIPFTLDGMTLSASPYLLVGSIIGIDTKMAHYLAGNNMVESASPLLIRLNGTEIAQVQVNGDNQRINLPRNLLHTTGSNTLEIEAGFQYPEPGRIDYDDMELMHLVVYP